ncbi:MAG: D-Ala-D-Ala carboxypeptidase family metallohydrolase [Cyanobacteriota bacterium]|nr:D-Ala-D-Ala carboxypeptidase family metallohydrolase [Cyanobacteriota bacterium]
MNSVQVSVAEPDWNNPAARLSTYFRVGEMTLGDPRRIPLDPVVKARIVRFAQELNKVRAAWGSGLGVTSWYRPYLVNLAVGGVPNSQHVLGWAADVYPVNGKISEFQTWIDLRWSGGLGYGAQKGFVHLDARDGFPCFGDRKRGVRWIY